MSTVGAKNVLLLVALVLGSSCSSSPQTDNVIDTKQPEQTDNTQKGLLDHETTQDQDKQLYEQSKLGPGDLAPDIELMPFTDSALGSAVKLSSLYKEKPLVVFMGSCTCGLTKEKVPQLEQLYKEYGDRSHFAFVYMKDAHPSPQESVEVDGKEVFLAQPKNLEHRVDLAKYLLAETGLTLPVYIDDMKGTGRKAYSGFHLAAYVINIDGKLALAERYKYDVADVERALVSLLDTN